MDNTRRNFLRLAGRTVLVSAAVAGGGRLLVSGRKHETVSRSVPISHIAERMPEVGLVRRIKAISNVFEVGRPEPDYAYVENLNDGRGYTVTQYGFCTYNTEVTRVIERYARFVPDTGLKRFLPCLPPLATGKADALSDFPTAWRGEIRDNADYLLIACDDVADRLYLHPALKTAAAAGIQLAIGESIFYDTWLQHGAGDDPDSLTAILKRTSDETGGLDCNFEREFLRAFLAIRKEVLLEPANRATREVWRASVSRVDALQHLVDSNPDLVPPIEVAVTATPMVVL